VGAAPLGLGTGIDSWWPLSTRNYLGTALPRRLATSATARQVGLTSATGEAALDGDQRALIQLRE